ncbi:MAG: hypothetical protein KKG47_00805, partial [Proteobacteria bacterium]|nr:hypothetical protein [Pseudomonadota bacterium]MBU1738551.1 hypothetical protein [Pseudomonadota bacterium]
MMKVFCSKYSGLFSAQLFLLLSTLLLITTFAQAYGGPGRYDVPLVTRGSQIQIGTVSVWNSPKNLIIQITPLEGLLLKEAHVFAGEDINLLPTTKKGNPKPGQFPWKVEYKKDTGVPQHTFVLDLKEDLGFSWGQDNRIRFGAVHAEVIKTEAFVDTCMADCAGTCQATCLEDLVCAETCNLACEAACEDNDLLASAYGDRLGAWSYGPYPLNDHQNSWYFDYLITHPKRGQFIDGPVQGLTYSGPTQNGTTGPDETGKQGGFVFFPGEDVSFYIGNVLLGTATAAHKLSPLDLFSGKDTADSSVVGVAKILQTLDGDGKHDAGSIVISPETAACFQGVVTTMGLTNIDFADSALVDTLADSAIANCNGVGGVTLSAVTSAEAQANLEAGISASGIFRKNVSKEADLAATQQKLEIMPVYFPGERADGTPSFCDTNANGIYDEGEEGVPYEEWRLGGDPAAAECDPRETEDCVITMIECREIAKPILVTYEQSIDLNASNVTTAFDPHRFSDDIFTAISRDDGATWKRMNISRMADLSSFDLETGEPFPGISRKPQLKIIDNMILVSWVSPFCRGGNPRYSITTCDNPDTPEVETPETGCQIVCRGDAEQGTEVCEPDYPYDDAYYVNDIWGVSGHQGSVNYDEVDDVADLGIGEIPYSCLWAARGVILTQADIDSGNYASLYQDDPATPEIETLEVGEIVWFKPERLTSGRRDAFIPMMGGTRGAGFAIVWQEDPKGLRPGKGKGPGEGWSGAISNHKTDIWYSYITPDNFAMIDENFIPGGTPDEERPGIGRPKAMVPFSLPVRLSDNDMVNTDTLKVELDSGGLPLVVDGSYVPVDPLTVEHGNATGTKRYAYLAKTDDLYSYYWDKLDLCDTTGSNLDVLEALPGTANHERWYHFLNSADADKTVCITSDGRLLDGDVSASRANISLQPYTKPDGTKSAWALISYEETKGMGETLADSHDVDPLTIAEVNEDSGADKPVKQDMGKNVIYHSFDYTQPDLISAGHIINLPALCGGLYPNYCDEIDNPTCTCEAGQPIPIYFDNAEGNPDPNLLLQYRTEIARRTRFLVQSTGRMQADGGTTGTLGAIIYKQGQEGQGRPADVFIRRVVKPAGDTGNPYKFANFECNSYLDQTFSLPGCPGDGVVGYNCNAWGEAYGDRLCGGTFTDPNNGYLRRDHINLTSSDILYSVDAGPEDDTPEDPTDDMYGTEKVLMWNQNPYNLGDESFGAIDGLTPGISGMYSNARSHRGFIRGDFLLAAYAFSPNWAAGRNGHDRYNFYIRKSFDGGQTWTTNPAGNGVNICPEWRSDPTVPDEDGSGNTPPAGIDPDCVDWCAPDDPECVVTGTPYAAGAFEPARNISSFPNNKQTSGDPRVGATPPVRPLDGRDSALPEMEFVEDTYQNNVFFIAWGANSNVTSTGGEEITPEAPPKDVYYTRSENYGDTFLKIPWNVNPEGNSENWEQGEIVWRYDFLAHGEEEQGECQLRATSDGSKMYAIWH